MPMSIPKNLGKNNNGMENDTLDFLERNDTCNNTSGFYINEYHQNVANILGILTVIIIMISIGADISWNQIYKDIRRPAGPAIGIFCQFIMMPLIGFIYNIIFQFESSLAAGLHIISCCPGGIVSNVFTYYLDGDLSLSVTMTTISTLASFGMMPLNIWIYANHTKAKNLIIPYGNVALSLLLIIPPVILGMIIKWKAPKVSPYITKWGGATGLFLIIAMLVVYTVYFKHVFDIISWKIIITFATLPITGIIIGYAVAHLCRRPRPVSTAIAIESGIQNVAVAYMIITLSFDISKNILILLFPLLYGLSQCITCSLLCIIFYFLKNTCKKFQLQDTNIDDKENEVCSKL
ncbi:solute carrier family 10 member 6-like [Centruroides sculpturatus]|uniref:solute carrier family 10 member 6-like n=1 Tax=Centruroides sculpturatus TaxID=218467 RepID=UPI000C6D4B84|nr:solute carrier family 10 member 6-like [Centruroides sculpturatus]XP_023234765.1 solute carrier family 10 member 6-like [Centruroides sculpturatus]